ncbi:MAG: nuclear transport factor 2 family protein [Caulobacterales bacterium]|nr:nuclear transport factor 2 family protein [Caulobacterales bacterium]
MIDDTLVEIAATLVANCRANRALEGLDELYAPDAVSVECGPMPATGGAESVGLDAIKGKHHWWASAMEVHSATVDGPFFHGPDRFGVIFGVDATNRESNERTQMRELAIYTVKDRKIVREEFYNTV